MKSVFLATCSGISFSPKCYFGASSQLEHDDGKTTGEQQSLQSGDWLSLKKDCEFTFTYQTIGTGEMRLVVAPFFHEVVVYSTTVHEI